jgi:hypothetical protein
MRDMLFHFITVVWGREYTRVFLDICLPNQLTKGNLYAFQGGPEAEYKVYTTSEDAERIRENKLFQEVESIMPTRIIEIDKAQGGSDYSGDISLMNRVHIMAIKEGIKKDATFVFIPPDQIYSEGAFARLIDIARTGKRVVVTAGIRISKETFVPEFIRKFRDPDGRLCASSRPLVELGLRHLHPIIKSYFVDSEEYNYGPAHFYWRVDESGFIVRALSVHPLMIRPRIPDALPLRSVDGDYFRRACPDIRDYHIVKDSDELVALELTTSDFLFGINGPNKFNIYQCAMSVKHGGDRMHRKFLREKIRIHSGDFSPQWNEVEELSATTIETARMIVAVSYKAPLHRHLFAVKPVVLDHVKKVLIFGARRGGVKAAELAKRCDWEIVCYVDNDKSLHGSFLENRPVKDISALETESFDIIIVASIPGGKAIFWQLIEAGLAYKKDFIYFLDQASVDGVVVSLDLDRLA